MSPPEAEWALALFKRSVLKQAKLQQILARMDDPTGKTSLDIGADNGVISYLLRQRGGRWHSADLDEHTVESIRGLVGDRVYRIDGGATPFEDAAFDQIDTEAEMQAGVDRRLEASRRASAPAIASDRRDGSVPSRRCLRCWLLRRAAGSSGNGARSARARGCGRSTPAR